MKVRIPTTHLVVDVSRRGGSCFGLGLAMRPCLELLGKSTELQGPSVQVNVIVNSSTLGQTVDVPELLGSRNNQPTADGSSSSRGPSGVRISGKDRRAEELSVHTSARATSLRIPETLTPHFTATGERWHQDPDFGDIRGRISSRFLPCRNCTVGRLPVAPPPLPLGQLRQRRRRG